MTLRHQQREKVVISGGEVLQDCTNNRENVASLPDVKLHPEDDNRIFSKAQILLVL